jgi:hypothetical protein
MITGILTMGGVMVVDSSGGTIQAGLEDGLFKLDVVDEDNRWAVVWLDRKAVIKLIAAGAAALMDM